MAGFDIRSKFTTTKVYRGTQAIFGEREHLRRVLASVRRARFPEGRKRAELKALEKLIRQRTVELNSINPGWERKYKKARDRTTAAPELLRLAASLPPDDYLLARLLTEHPEAPGELLESLKSHSYAAVRENVARHPHTPAPVLRKIAESPHEPLWFLVACNPATPKELRQRLRKKIQQTSRNQ